MKAWLLLLGAPYYGVYVSWHDLPIHWFYCAPSENLLVWVCCYSNLKMETKLWRGESVGGALKMPMPLVLMQRVQWRWVRDPPLCPLLLSAVLHRPYKVGPPWCAQASGMPGQRSHCYVVFFPRLWLWRSKCFVLFLLRQAKKVGWRWTNTGMGSLYGLR